MIPSVYLAGPIAGCSDEEANGWRDLAARALRAANFVVSNPMERDYRGREAGNAREIVDADLRDIRECEFMLANATRPSWGTAMEIMYAAGAGSAWREARGLGRIRIVTFGAAGVVSPWLAYCATNFATLSWALQDLGVPVLTVARAGVKVGESAPAGVGPAMSPHGFGGYADRLVTHTQDELLKAQGFPVKP